jgi:molybdopterin/thiamine biosynthesis adenylyltransferase
LNRQFLFRHEHIKKSKALVRHSSRDTWRLVEYSHMHR